MKPGYEAFALIGVAAIVACLVYRSKMAPVTQVSGASFHGGGSMRGGSYHGVRRGGVVYVAPSLPAVYEYADPCDLGTMSTQALLTELRRRRVIS